MPRRQIAWNNFTGGLWVSTPKDHTPDGYLRRARGVSDIARGAIRSRVGDVFLGLANDAVALFRFDNVLWEQTSLGDLYRNGVLVGSGYGATRCAFVRMKPGASSEDRLYVCNGVKSRAYSPGGTEYTWGIEPPPDGFTAVKASTLQVVIDTFDADDWTESGLTAALEGTIKQEGTSSLAVSVAANAVGVLSKAITVDLSAYTGPVVSPDEDYIAFWVRVNLPENLAGFDVQFSVGNATFISDTYTKRIFVAEAAGTTEVTRGSANYPGVFETQSGLDFANTEDSRFLIREFLGEARLPVSKDTWIRCLIPKSNFTRSGDGASGWAAVQAVRFVFQTAERSPVTIYLDDLVLTGSVGMQGTYKFLVTYREEDTGTRSNSNLTPVVVENVVRQPVSFNSLPVSSDSRVDQREIWGTLGGGSLYFRGAIIDDNTATSYTYETADFTGLDSSDDALVLESTELPTDNTVPESTYGDAAGPYLGRMLWCRDSATGARGRLYYSPISRPDSVEGFLDITDDDDPTQKVVIWNGIAWVFTEAHLFRIDGNTVLAYREVFGVPGTTKPYTVIATPYGILYQSLDGVRVFDGNRSQLVASQGILTLFRGEDSDNLDAFVGVVAAYHDEEYFISDREQTLAVNLTTGAWRDLGVGFSCFYNEPDTDRFIAGGGDTVELEQRGYDQGTRDFDIETGHVSFGHELTIVEQVYIDVEHSSDSINTRALLDDQEYGLITTAAASRHLVPHNIQKHAKRLGVRVDATLSGLLQVHAIVANVRNVPLSLLVNDTSRYDIGGRLEDLADGVSFDGIDEVLGLDNISRVPEVRRLWIDARANGNEIVPVFEFYSTTMTYGAHTGQTQLGDRIVFLWDINRAERLHKMTLEVNLNTVVIYQIALDIFLGATV